MASKSKVYMQPTVVSKDLPPLPPQHMGVMAPTQHVQQPITPPPQQQMQHPITPPPQQQMMYQTIPMGQPAMMMMQQPTTMVYVQQPPPYGPQPPTQHNPLDAAVRLILEAPPGCIVKYPIASFVVPGAPSIDEMPIIALDTNGSAQDVSDESKKAFDDGRSPLSSMEIMATPTVSIALMGVPSRLPSNESRTSSGSVAAPSRLSSGNNMETPERSEESLQGPAVWPETVGIEANLAQMMDDDDDEKKKDKYLSPLDIPPLPCVGIPPSRRYDFSPDAIHLFIGQWPREWASCFTVWRVIDVMLKEVALPFHVVCVSNIPKKTVGEKTGYVQFDVAILHESNLAALKKPLNNVFTVQRTTSPVPQRTLSEQSTEAAVRLVDTKVYTVDDVTTALNQRLVCDVHVQNALFFVRNDKMFKFNIDPEGIGRDNVVERSKEACERTLHQHLIAMAECGVRLPKSHRAPAVFVVSIEQKGNAKVKPVGSHGWMQNMRNNASPEMANRFMQMYPPMMQQQAQPGFGYGYYGAVPQPIYSGGMMPHQNMYAPRVPAPAAPASQIPAAAPSSGPSKSLSLSATPWEPSVDPQ